MSGLTISDKADLVGAFRAVSVFLMETLARWTPTAPEFEVKVLFGRHLWEFAQHADALGRRTAELRAALHYTRPPVAAYQAALDALAAETASASRVAAVYDAAIPDLQRRYRVWLDQADRLLDEPTIRIVERALADLARMRVERREFLSIMPAPLAPEPAVAARFAERLASVDGFVDFRSARAGVA
jgi:hypothetical protein